MAEATTNVSDLASQLGKVAEQMERNEKAAKGIEFSFFKIASAVGAVDLLKDALIAGFKNSETWLKVQQMFTEEKLAELGYTRKMVAIEGAGLAMALSMGRELYLNERMFNQNLIEANASWKHRSGLLIETLVTQTQIGMSFGDITKAAAALVSYSLDTESTFKENVRLVVQMEQGLGVSVGASAQLASIVERQLRGSFTDVAHVIAQIVDDTALAGDEAVRLATAVATILGRLRPGIGAAALPEIVKLVGRYESALKEVGGVPGAFQQLVTSLTTPGGIVGAGVLGVSPEFIATAQGVEQVMDRFAKYGEMLVGQSQGWERQFRLQMLAEVFNTTADSANQMLIAIQRAKEQQVGQISIQDRWRNQLHATNAGLSRLGNSLMGLAQGALYPVVFLVGALANALADLVQWITKSRTVVYILGGVVGVAITVLTARMISLAASMYAAATGSTVLQAALARLAFLAVPFRALSAAWTAQAGARVFGFAPMFGRTLLTSLSIWLAPLAFMGVMLGMIYKVNKDSRDEQIAAHKIQVTMADRLQAQTRARLYAAARSERPEEEILKLYKSLANQAMEHGKTPAEQKAWLDEQLKAVDLDVLKATATAGMFTPLTERSPKQVKHEDAMRNINEKLLKVNEDQKVLIDKAAKRAEENARDAEIEAAKNRVWYLKGSWNPLGVASDYYSDLFSK